MFSANQFERDDITSFIIKHADFNAYLSKINPKLVITAIFSIQYFTDVNWHRNLLNVYFHLDRIVNRILYFDHSKNRLFREYHDQSRIEQLVYLDDVEQYWQKREDFYTRHFPISGSILINLYQDIKNKIGYIDFGNYCQIIEDLVLEHVSLLLDLSNPYQDLIAMPENGNRREYRIPPSKMAEYCYLLARGYRNLKTFALHNKIDSIPAENLLILDGYAFDADELVRLTDGQFYINPHSNKEYTEESKELIKAHPRLQARAEKIEKDLLAGNSMLSQETISFVIDFNDRLNHVPVGDLNEEEAFFKNVSNKFSKLPSLEQQKLNNQILRLGNIQMTFQEFYTKLFEGKVCILTLKKLLHFFVEKLKLSLIVNRAQSQPSYSFFPLVESRLSAADPVSLNQNEPVVEFNKKRRL